jgi:hypothetical protein
LKKGVTCRIEIPRMKVRKKQSNETLIDKESFPLSKYIIDEREIWTPRLAVI